MLGIVDYISDNTFNTGVILAIAMVVYIFARNIYLIAEGFRDQNPKQTKTVYLTAGTIIITYVVMVLLMFLANYFDLHVTFLLVIMIGMTFFAGYITHRNINKQRPSPGDIEINHEDDLEKKTGVQLNYHQRQLFKRQEYQQLAAVLRARIGKGWWLMKGFETVLFIGGLAVVGWLYTHENVVSWNVGVTVILSGVIFAMDDEMDKNLKDAAACLDGKG